MKPVDVRQHAEHVGRTAGFAAGKHEGFKQGWDAAFDHLLDYFNEENSHEASIGGSQMHGHRLVEFLEKQKGRMNEILDPDYDDDDPYTPAQPRGGK